MKRKDLIKTKFQISENLNYLTKCIRVNLLYHAMHKREEGAEWVNRQII